MDFPGFPDYLQSVYSLIEDRVK